MSFVFGMISQHEGFVSITGCVLGMAPKHSLGALMNIQNFKMTLMKHLTLQYISKHCYIILAPILHECIKSQTSGISKFTFQEFVEDLGGKL